MTKRLDPARFTIKTMLARMDKVGDLWEIVLRPGIDLEKWMQQLQKSFRT